MRRKWTCAGRGPALRCFYKHIVMQTFAKLFCEHYHVAPQRYQRAVFWRCLHRRAWVLAPLLLLLNRDFFTADFDLIERIRTLKSASELYGEVDDFNAHPWNCGFARRWLRMRLSIRRLTHLVNHVFAKARRDAADLAEAERDGLAHGHG